MPESVTDRPTRAHEYLFLLTKSARYFWDADAIREPHSEATIQRDKSPRGRSQNGGGSDESMAGYDYSREGLGDMQSHAGGRNKRSVWTVATQPYPDAHFATFPPKLVEPCILAGSPPKCCGECGAPWERVVERRVLENSAEVSDARKELHGPTYSRHKIKIPGGQSLCSTQTIGRGWTATCSHHDAIHGRSVVLDPFAGSGTTGVVALRHDRSFIGIELSSDYCEMARNRIRDDAPLLNMDLEVAA